MSDPRVTPKSLQLSLASTYTGDNIKLGMIIDKGDISILLSIIVEFQNNPYSI